MDEVVVCDLSRFGFRELQLAAELLKAYTEQGADFLGEGIQICFNTGSGYVFLSDEDSNVAILNGDKLEQFFSCPDCGQEGFQEDGGFDASSHLCRDCQVKAGQEMEQTCNECSQSVAPGSGRFVNRVPDFNDSSYRRKMGKPFPAGDFVCAECDERCCREATDKEEVKK